MEMLFEIQNTIIYKLIDMDVYQHPQVRNSEDLQLVTKVTNTTPHFVASRLDPGTAYTLHVAVHSPMGASTPIKLQAFTVKTAEKRMG